MEQEIDILIDAIDQALMSDNPAVKLQLQKLLVISALTATDDGARPPGPLRLLISDVGRLDKRLADLESVCRGLRNKNDNYYGAGGYGGYTVGRV